MRSVLLAVLGTGLLTAGCGAAGTTAPSVVTHAPAVTPYSASVAFARCMRARGVPHPSPDRSGDFHLTPAQERLMRRVPQAKREAASEACFHFLKPVVSTKPLSAHAKASALVVLGELGRCLRSAGYKPGKPIVRDLTLGRAFFGFARAPVPRDAQDRKRLAQTEQTCEQRVQLARRINRIIAIDRAPY